MDSGDNVSYIRHACTIIFDSKAMMLTRHPRVKLARARARESVRKVAVTVARAISRRGERSRSGGALVPDSVEQIDDTIGCVARKIGRARVKGDSSPRQQHRSDFDRDVYICARSLVW